MTDLLEAYAHLYRIASISLFINGAVLAVVLLDRFRKPSMIDWREMRKLW
jgi:hypothetical protein